MGEIKIMQQGDHCCWICNPCKDQEYVIGEFTCKKCPDGWWPHQDNKSGCYQLPEQYMRWDSVFAIVPVSISVLGILLTLFVIWTFVKYMETPIVKASGRELSFILLGGILLSFLMSFILLAKPSLIICSLQRFGVGFGFSIIYGALLTKTNRISRIFESARRSARRPSFISPKSQVIICMIFVSIQVNIYRSHHSHSLFSCMTIRIPIFDLIPLIPVLHSVCVWGSSKEEQNFLWFNRIIPFLLFLFPLLSLEWRDSSFHRHHHPFIWSFGRQSENKSTEDIELDLERDKLSVETNEYCVRLILLRLHLKLLPPTVRTELF